MRKNIWLVSGAALVIGASCGVGLTAVVYSAQEPEVEVVERSPLICAEAFMESEYIIDLYADSVQQARQGIEAYRQNDPTLITQATSRIQENSAEMDQSFEVYFDQKERCLSHD